MGPERAQASGASEKAMLHSILVGAVFTAMVLASLRVCDVREGPRLAALREPLERLVDERAQVPAVKVLVRPLAGGVVAAGQHLET